LGNTTLLSKRRGGGVEQAAIERREAEKVSRAPCLSPG
jgi:hypothetical protein